jgi:hypothetical protein
LSIQISEKENLVLAECLSDSDGKIISLKILTVQVRSRFSSKDVGKTNSALGQQT